jgi:hypothetical protein
VLNGFRRTRARLYPPSKPFGRCDSADRTPDARHLASAHAGAKRWRLYNRPDCARAPGATKTTEFTAAQLGEPTAELTLRPGDVLYLPRGVVHQVARRRHRLAIAQAPTPDPRAPASRLRVRARCTLDLTPSPFDVGALPP